jgi:hypothetical protein
MGKERHRSNRDSNERCDQNRRKTWSKIEKHLERKKERHGNYRGRERRQTTKTMKAKVSAT